MTHKPRALIAMSGGVDSSAAAKLMQDAGFDCVGCTMQLYRGAEGERSVRSTQRAAEQLGIPFYVFDLTQEFQRDVVERFVCSYEAGDTPNPCIACNRHLKFGVLLRRVEELDCACLVTGHYARIEERDGRYLLKKAADRSKDQTYFLASLTQAQLARVRFPLGELPKARVRELARQWGLVSADRQDSQDICFVPDGDYAAFMERYRGRPYPAGDFLDLAGRTVGRHRGAVRYTLGQRRGLDLALGEPVYVCAKDMAANTVTVGPDSALYTGSLTAEGMNWIAPERPEGPLRVTARTRYSQREQAAAVFPLEGGRARVEFDAPQRAVTPGQAVVFYDGETVVGGGTIARQPYEDRGENNGPA